MEPRREVQRIEGFSDAVFAIAITLLVVDFKVPPPGAPGLLAKLLDQWPEHLTFLATFGTIAIMWIFHHRVFSLITRADYRLLVFNCLLLLGVVTIPFYVKLLVEYARNPDERVAAMIHSGTFVMITVFFSLLWRHASRHHLLDPAVDPRKLSVVNRTFRLAPLLYLPSFFLASVIPAGSSVLNIVIAVYLAAALK